MNPNRVAVILDANLVRISIAYGEAVVKWYASPEGRASASRSRSGIWGAESNPIRLGQGKAGEYAVAQFFGLDLETAVKRKFTVADNGHDIEITPSVLADVKTTPTFKRWMLWSLSVNDLYWEKRFNTLICVSVDEHDWSRCWIEGWMTKQEFFQSKKIANGTNDSGRLTIGTWFVDKSVLNNIKDLNT